VEERPDSRKRLKCISCEVLARAVYKYASQTPHVVNVEVLEKALHNRPEGLRKQLQEGIANCSSQRYDAVVLAYGLCGKAAAGLQAGEIPLVIPRAHDCITLFLGSREKYQEEFEKEPGTFWFIPSYMERDLADVTDLFLGPGFSSEWMVSYQELVTKYGEDNARYLIDTMGIWRSNYRRAAFVPGEQGDSKNSENKAREEAASNGWDFEVVEGSSRLLKKLLFGTWDEEFLIIPPGHNVKMVTDERVIDLVPLSS
jgi:hypothetical protein